MPLAWPGRLTVLLLAVASCLLFLIAGADRVGGEHHRIHRHHVVYTPLQILNPWLSACDVAHPASAPDLQGPCSATTSETSRHALRNTRGAGALSPSTAATQTPLLASSTHAATSTGPGSGPGCPKPCARNSSQNQCLHYLQESHKDSVCQAPSKEVLAGLRLRYCCEHTALSALHPEALQSVLKGGQACHMYIKAVLEVDTLAARVACEFSEILTRFDCDHAYSMDFGCADCQEAYRQWVCDSLVPHFPVPGGPRQRPCRSVCQTVEQRCPFFLPSDRWPNLATQYAGEPTFLCIDPNIPETEAQRNKSLYGDRDCCYNHCDTPERGICPAMNCVDSSGAGNGNDVLPAPLHCTPFTISTPTSPTDRSASPATTCVATSGGPMSPARSSSSLNRALAIVTLMCLVALQAVLVQHIAFVACWWLTLSLRRVTRTLRPVTASVSRTVYNMVSTALCVTVVRFCIWIVGILSPVLFAFNLIYCPSASEFKIMRRLKRSFSRPLLKLLVETVLLKSKADRRTTTDVTSTPLRVVLKQLFDLDYD